MKFNTKLTINCLVERLYEDTHLFPNKYYDDDIDIKYLWGRKCQSRDNARRPKIITEDQKKIIDKYYPNSYDNVDKIIISSGNIVSNTSTTITLKIVNESTSSKKNLKYKRISIKGSISKDYFITDYDYKKNKNTITIDTKTDILTDNILQNEPYEIYSAGIDCDEKLDYKINKKDNIKCKSLMLKYNDEKRYYICPMIWDSLENISLEPKHLKYKNNTDGEFVSKYVDKKKAFQEKWDKDTIQTYPDDHSKKGEAKNITDFKPYFEGYNKITDRGVLDDKRVIPTYNKSLVLSKKYGNKFYKYPGFIEINENGELLPCCFKQKSAKVNKKWGSLLDETKTYVNDKKKLLHPGSIAFIPDNLFTFMGITESAKQFAQKDDEIDHTINIFNIRDQSTHINKLFETSSDMTPILIRKGLHLSDDNCFLSLLINLKKPIHTGKLKKWTSQWGETQQEQIRYLKKLIVDNLTEEEFKTLNKGSLEIMFRDHLTTKISSFQNFIEYLLSNSEKYYYDFWDYLTRPHPWLFEKGLKLLIIDKTTKDYKILNPYFFKNDSYTTQTPFSIIIKTKRYEKDYFEPIYLYYKQHNFVKTTKLSSWNHEYTFNHIKIFNHEHPLYIYKQTFDHINQYGSENDFIKKTPDDNSEDHTYTYFINKTSTTEKELEKLDKTELFNLINQFDISDLDIAEKDINPKKTFVRIQMNSILLNIYNYFEHIRELFAQVRSYNLINKEYTLNYYLEQSDNYKHIIVNSYNKIVLLQRKDNIFIPIIDDSLTNVHILQQKQLTEIKLLTIFKNLFKQKYHNKLPTLTKQLEFLNSSSNYKPLSLIIRTKKTTSYVYGILTKHNNIIPVQETEYSNDEYGSFHTENINIILADIGIESYSKYHLSKIFKPTQTFIDLETKINMFENYSIQNIYTSLSSTGDNYCNGIGIAKDTTILYLHIDPVLVDDIINKDKYTEIVIDDSSDPFTTDLPYTTILQEYELLYKISSYGINCNPMRYILNPNTKQIDAVILENGTEIYIQPVNKLAITKLNDKQTDYVVHSLNHNNFISKLDFLSNMYYKDEDKIDERIKNINIINYNDKINTIIEISLTRFFNDNNNKKSKEYITFIIEREDYIVEEKFILIYPVIKRIFDILFQHKEYSSKMIDVSSLDKCYNIMSENDIQDNKNKCVANKCSWKRQDDGVTPQTITDQNIIDDINSNFIDDSEYIEIDDLNDLYQDILPRLKQTIQELYKNIYINCKQSIYEIHEDHEHFYKNLLYKFTYSIINNYIIRTSILEDIQLTKNDLLYVVKKDEIKFDQEDITSNNINLFFKESMNYNYIREKNIIDYFINWNKNTYIPIQETEEMNTLLYDNEYKYQVIKSETDSSDSTAELRLDMTNISFIYSIMIEDIDNPTNNNTYSITELQEDSLLQ